MSGITFDPEFSDVNNDGYVSGSISVSTTQVEAKVGTNRLVGREVLTITNNGPNVVYYGPTGVTATTGDKLLKGQFLSTPLGSAIGLFLICATGQTATVIVQEIA
jgi:hypothetical protein